MPTVKNDTTQPITVDFLVDGNRKYLEPGEEITTDRFFTEASATALGLTWVAATPYFNMALVSETLTFSIVGTQDTDGDNHYEDCPIIRILATAAVTVKANSSGATNFLPVPPNVAVDFKNNSRVDSLSVTCTQACTVHIAGLREEDIA